jgi:hypothetical protein
VFVDFRLTDIEPNLRYRLSEAAIRDSGEGLPDGGPGPSCTDRWASVFWVKGCG